MSHTCSHALVRCMDFRLGSAIRDYLNEKGLYDQTDIISIAGAAKDLNDPNSDILLTQLKLSKDLHDVQTIILMHHTDCGGYGGRGKHENPEAEHAFHLEEMNKAKTRIESEIPGVEIKFVLADIKEDGSITIEDLA